jgi:parallel beta-helix repeat protein
MKTTAIAICALVLLASGPLSGATLRVPSVYRTIQAGVNAATDGDTVLVAAGTYAIANGESYHTTVHYKIGLTLISESGKELTILSGSFGLYSETLMNFYHSTDCTLNGFTLRNAYNGINISLCSGIKIVDCNIDNASETGIKVGWDNSTVEISNNSIYENGSGVQADGNGILLSNNRISDNTSGIIFIGGSGIIRSNDVFDNLEYGIRVDRGAQADLTIESNIIHNNLDTGLRYWCGGNNPIRNNTISGNGFYGILVNGGTPDIQHNIIASNVGAGIAVELQGNPYIACNDVWGNSHYANGNYVGYITDQTGYNGNISTDPYFCNASGGVYSLAANSPALHASCGPMGAILIPGCSNQTAVEHLSWGSIKALYK